MHLAALRTKGLIQLGEGGLSTLRRPQHDRPACGVKARRAFRWRTMVAFHKEFRVSPRLAVESMLRNKIPETLKLGCLCNGTKTPIMTTNFT